METLMRVEDEMEFRIDCEDVEGCPIGIVTEGILTCLRIYGTMRQEKQVRQGSKASHLGQCDSNAADKARTIYGWNSMPKGEV
jgi:hypothetical protein